jgi:hypothetical protein
VKGEEGKGGKMIIQLTLEALHGCFTNKGLWCEGTFLLEERRVVGRREGRQVMTENLDGLGWLSGGVPRRQGFGIDGR